MYCKYTGHHEYVKYMMYQGPRGKRGYKGNQGIEGYQGKQGFRGYEGIEGEKGEQGEPGKITCESVEYTDVLEEDDFVVILRNIGCKCKLFKIPIDIFYEICSNSEGCETAWSKDIISNKSRCFLTFSELKANRWGWSNGPYIFGQTVFHELWMGVGQCDTDKGTLVGMVEIDIFEEKINIHVEMGKDFCLCDEIQVYVGNSPLFLTKKDKPSVAPGLFRCKKEITGDNCDELDLECDIIYYENMGADIYILIHTSATEV